MNQIKRGVGELQHAAGTVFNSADLQAKGAAKIGQTDALRHQQEMGQADALDTQARMARERAGVHAARGGTFRSMHDAAGTHGAGTADPTAGGGVPRGQR